MKSRLNRILFVVFVLLTIRIGITVAQDNALAPARATDSEWHELFNGENLNGWAANVHPESFSVVDGVLKAHGKNGMSHLFFVGEEGTDVAFKNFELIVVTRCEPNSNSGIFFHTGRELRKGKYLNKGYEVQLNNSQKEKQKTGSLYAIRPVDVSPIDETEWFEIRIRVNGKRIQVFVNDKSLIDYEEPANPQRVESRAKRLIDPNGGALAIQAHDPNSVFYFKQIRIRELSKSGLNQAVEPSVESAESIAIVDAYAAHKAEAEELFREQVTPFIKTYCIDCHQNRRPTEAGVNFSPALKHPGHAAFSHQWRKAGARVKAHDMPPEEMEQPTDDERKMFGVWLEKVKFLSPKDPGPFVIRRLTKAEYGNTLHDLFGVDPKIADGLPEEVSGEGYLNSLSPLQMEQYLSIAESVLDEDVLKRLLRGPAENEAESRVVARNVVQPLARRAYRRPPSDEEIDVLLDVFDLAKRNDLDHSQSVRLMLKAVLVSPQFLFITPAEGVAGDKEIVRLDDHQLAARLSYLLWATMPDDELMELADHGKLHEPEVLKGQITRLLMDSRSRALFDGFGAQWLGVGDLQERTFDPEKFPQMTAAMRSAMYDEVRLLFESIVREDRSVSSFIDCDYTFLNEKLATIYGTAEAITGSEMRKVTLSDRNRGGILGMAGVLAATSFPNRTSAVNRGVWVLERVLGDHVPSAPPDVPALETQEEEAAANLTLRERTELHRKDPVCANCHKILDPIGFGLENFDAIGRWRDVDDNGQAIDAAGELPGGKRFSTPEELKVIIAGRVDDFSRNLVEKLLAYALCRRLEGYDEIVVDKLMQEIAEDGYRMQTLIRAVVTSYPFTHRRLHEDNPGRIIFKSRKTSNEQKRD